METHFEGYVDFVKLYGASFGAQVGQFCDENLAKYHQFLYAI
jgi:hypothetical protein